MQVNNEETMLALKSASTEVEALVVNAQELVKAISAKYRSIVPDAETKEGYKFCKEVRAEVMPIKTELEKVRKQLKEPVLSMGKLIDSNIKPLIESLDDIYKPFEAAYREIDNRKKRLEEERQAKIQAAFDAMNDAAMNAIGQTTIVIESIIDDVACTSFDKEIFQERQEEAVGKHAELMGKLEPMLTQAKAQEELEAKQREIEAREAKIRAEEEKREREEAEAKRQQELAEAAEQARVKAEVEAEERERVLKLKAEQAAKQAEIEKQAAVEKAKEEERLNLNKILEAEKKKQDELAANRAHVGKIRKQTKEDLINMGVSEILAKDIVLAISKNQIRNLTINY